MFYLKCHVELYYLVSLLQWKAKEKVEAEA